MTKTSPDKPAKQAAQAREDRLKKALKANLQRRKAQGRARSAEQSGDDTVAGGHKGQDDG